MKIVILILLTLPIQVFAEYLSGSYECHLRENGYVACGTGGDFQSLTRDGRRSFHDCIVQGQNASCEDGNYQFVFENGFMKQIWQAPAWASECDCMQAERTGSDPYIIEAQQGMRWPKVDCTKVCQEIDRDFRPSAKRGCFTPRSGKDGPNECTVGCRIINEDSMLARCSLDFEGAEEQENVACGCYDEGSMRICPDGVFVRVDFDPNRINRLPRTPINDNPREGLPPFPRPSTRLPRPLPTMDSRMDYEPPPIQYFNNQRGSGR